MIETMWQPNRERQSAQSSAPRSAKSAVKWCVCMVVTLIAACQMLGCAHGTTLTPIQPPIYPASLTAKCLSLPMASSGKLVDLINNHIDVAEQYHDCASTHNKLVDLINGR